ncbi:MAG: hypothetical protein JRG96_06825 [Deltaproteobacteria bacterium]|nr:hypothetical protein [Deltaproteobacteria bacterium]MBW2418636.1 hypothetical protein [Deltaproteobacteria bacterium]
MDLDGVIGLGVAGNFTGHLEQAGEAADFEGVEVRDAKAPKGVFPFYIPRGGDHFLHCFPLSTDRIRLPGARDDLQMEPEIALLCDLEYDGGELVRVAPRFFGAYNDCSIRRPGAHKISEKKNWGPASKGIAATLLPIDRFEPGGVLDHFRLASFLLRRGELHAYGVDSAVTGYSYFHGHLLDWLVERIGAQADEGPLESIADWLASAGHPKQALISIGATRYTDYGESHFLETGDSSIVVAYDLRRYDEEAIRQRVLGDDDAEAPGLSLLRQRVG